MNLPQNLVVRVPQTETEWKLYNQLRFRVLREPWNQPEGSEILEDDYSAIHAMILTSDVQVIGASRLHFPDEKTAQLRMMAIDPNWQGKGLGRLLVEYLEDKARKAGAAILVLEARENAVPFYKALGYEITKESYLLFGEIQHYTMEKSFM